MGFWALGLGVWSRVCACGFFSHPISKLSTPNSRSPASKTHLFRNAFEKCYMFARFLCAHLKGEARNSIKHGKGHLRKCTEAFTWPISFDGANSSVRSFVDLTSHPKELSLQQPSIAPCQNHKSCLIPDARFSAPNIRLSGAHAQEPRPYKDSTKPIHFV